MPNDRWSLDRVGRGGPGGEVMKRDTVSEFGKNNSVSGVWPQTGAGRIQDGSVDNTGASVVQWSTSLPRLTGRKVLGCPPPPVITR